MLSKEVCKQCYDRVPNIQWHWKALHEGDWKKGWVWCFHDFKATASAVYVREDPPEDCPFTLEHKMATQDLEPRNAP